MTIACTADGDLHAPRRRAFGARRPPARHDRRRLAFPDGLAVACQAEVSGPGGSATASIAFDAATPSPRERDPFPAVDEWLVVLSRDIFALEGRSRADGHASQADHVVAGNGVVDLDELLTTALRRRHPEGRRGAGEGAEEGARVRLQLLRPRRDGRADRRGRSRKAAPTSRAMRAHRARATTAVRAAFSEDRAGRRRRHPGPGAILGALIDWNNQETEDDTVYGLGIFPDAPLARQALAQPLGAILLQPYRVATAACRSATTPRTSFLGGELHA
ncbi:MAG: hypothetical protein U1F43_15505 [Myxococcota bacterium]